MSTKALDKEKNLHVLSPLCKHYIFQGKRQSKLLL